MTEKPTRKDMEKKIEQFKKDVDILKQTEATFLESEERYNSLFKNNHAAMLLIDPSSGNIVDANLASCSFYGWNREKLTQKKITDINILDNTQVLQAMERSESKQQRNFLFQHRLANGEIRDVEVFSSPIKLHGKQLLYSIIYDITDQKQMKESLRKSEEKYRLLFENTGTATFIVEEDMTIAQINSKCEELSGYSKLEIEGKMKTTDFMADEEIERLKKFHFGRRKGDDAIPTEYEFKLVDAKRRVKNVFIQTGMMPASKQSIASIIDITPLKTAEKALRESQEKYKDLVNSLPQVVFETDKDGIITFANRNAFDLFGYTQDDIDQGLDVFQMLTSNHWDRVAEDIQKVMRNQKLDNVEYTARKKDGRTFPVLVNVNAIIHENTPIGLRGILIDISDRKQAEKEKESLEVQLRQAQKMEAVGTLAGGIAHDFNNILNIILGNTELAMDEIPKWHPAGFNLNEIQKASMRARGVVRQLLNFSRKSDLKQKPISLIPVIKDALRFLRATLPKNIEIRQNIQNVPDIVFADPTQIHQVMINLFTNASHAIEDVPGVIEIGIERIVLDVISTTHYSDLDAGNFVKLSVSDTGPGIAPEIMDRIFDPYFTTKELGKGTGMGLSVVHGIVKNHGGAVTVESMPEKGATFNILLPVIEAEPESKIERHEKLPGGTERILFVDDEDSIVLTMQYRLERLGYQVKATTKPMDALELFKSDPHQFDLIITDMTMPDMNGDRLIKEVLKIRPHMPAILCTGFHEKISEEKAKKMGIVGYFEKPINKFELAGLVRKVLDEGKRVGPDKELVI